MKKKKQINLTAKNDENTEPEVEAVANLDADIGTETITGRPKRSNAGSGIDRLQMSFDNTEYKSAKQFNFTTIGKALETDHRINREITYLQLACNVLFTQMAKFKKGQKYAHIPATSGIKKIWTISCCCSDQGLFPVE
jgi:hypothetical protein